MQQQLESVRADAAAQASAAAKAAEQAVAATAAAVEAATAAGKEALMKSSQEWEKKVEAIDAEREAERKAWAEERSRLDRERTRAMAQVGVRIRLEKLEKHCARAAWKTR